jgi:endonuclease YncB( thermonuclease family)
MARRLQWKTRHKRLSLFWAAAVIGLLMPWLPSFSSDNRLSCTVNSIYDGDTMRVTCDGKRMKVRLYCIDAPEMGQRPWGKESRDYLRAIAPEQIAVVVHGRDRYGRTIGEVITDDADRVNLNLAMVLAGKGVVYPKYCNDRRYYQAEGEAKKIASGVWEKPGDHQRPWEWRR